MKAGFFPRLAVTGIQKNRRLYVPYVLSCIGMVMMYYIMLSLSNLPLLSDMKGGSTVEMVLTLGKFVIAVFAFIFLFYTNSFLIRRRNREFGLYNILGMDKKGISRVILWESLLISAVALAAGLALGILFSKFAELGLMNAIHAPVNFSFTVSPGAILGTVGIFAVIFAAIALRSVFLVLRSRPLELLHSENSGEKPPRANYVIAALGALLLAVAYVIAISIRSPLAAVMLFFAAVILVIIATYLLFISGSVVLCRILQKNRRYYYKKQHFISVSSMTFRMKRNGAGLASICILCTMVLVMISSTSSLYFGENDSLAARFPRENELALSSHSHTGLTDENVAALRDGYLAVFAEKGVKPENVTEFRYAETYGLLRGSDMTLDASLVDSAAVSFGDLRNVIFVTADDFNRTTGASLAPAPGEAYLYTLRCNYSRDTISFADGMVRFRIAGTLDSFIGIGTTQVDILPAVMLVIPDFSELLPLENADAFHGVQEVEYFYSFSYDLDADDDTVADVFRAVTNVPKNADFLREGGYSFVSGCLALERDDFFATYGGLFFLGILLSVLFIFAAAMIIYYKQVSEGFEDQARFEIMRKVGMSRDDIKKSINSQVLTVFFAPLLLAGLHLAFAFPMVWKLLMLFNLTNMGLAIGVNIAAFVVFGLIYAVIYRLTARAYFRIVAD